MRHDYRDYHADAMTLRDIFLALVRRKKIFWMVYVFILLVTGVAMVIHHQSKAFSMFVQPASYEHDGNSRYVSSLSDVASELQQITLPKVLDQYNEQHDTTITARSISITAPEDSSKTASASTATLLPPYIRFSSKGHALDQAAYQNIFFQLIKAMQQHEAPHIKALKAAWQQSLDLNKQQQQHTQALIKEFLQQATGVAGRYTENNPLVQLSGLVSILNGLQQNALGLNEQLSSLQTAKNVNDLSVMPVNSFLHNPFVSILLGIVLGFVVAFFIALMVDAISTPQPAEAHNNSK